MMGHVQPGWLEDERIMSDTKVGNQQEMPPAVDPSAEPVDSSAASSSIRQRLAGRASSDPPTVISNRPPMAAAPAAIEGVEIVADSISPGARLGHFELHEKIGGGGMGRVYRATDTRLGRVVALKVLSPEQAADRDTVLRFQNEARSSARLSHYGVAEVFYSGEDKGLPFIVFEFIEGHNLRNLVEQRGPLPLPEAISYTIQIAEALSHAAERNVVHRDVKPSNVLVMADGRTKLIDLGLARVQRGEESGSDLTASGVTLGTFDYISPEQARDPRLADGRSDMYSLGCTLFYMLAGRPPFADGTVLQKLLQHQGDEPPDIRSLRPELPEDVSRVLRKMMAKDPRRRFQNCAELIAALQALADRIGLMPAGIGRITWTVPPEPKASLAERHLPWIAPVAALVSIVLLLHFVWSPASPTSEPTLPIVPTETADAASNGLATVVDDVPHVPPGVPTGELAPRPPATSPAADRISETPPGTAAPEGEATDDTASRAAGQAFGAYLGPAGLKGGLSPPIATAGLTWPQSQTLSLSVLPETLALDGRAVVPPSGNRGAAKPSGATPASGSVLVVDPLSQTADGFRSLAAACRVATAGDLIELRFNGVSQEKTPIELAGRQLTIRAAEGYLPQIVFQPKAGDPIEYPRSMFRLVGGRLTMQGVGVELDLAPEVPADSWSLFEVRSGELLDLDRCWLTIRNASNRSKAYHREVGFIRLDSAPRSDMLVGGRDTASPVSIGLSNCVVRGEADFLCIVRPQPVYVKWQNGLLAISEAFLRGGGSETEPPPDQRVRIELDHITAIMLDGLCRISQSAMTTHPLQVGLQVKRSILLGAPSAPMLEQAGVASVESAWNSLSVTGEESYHGGFTDYWSIWPLDPESRPWLLPLDAPEQALADGIKLPDMRPVRWSGIAESSRPLHAQGPWENVLERIRSDLAGAVTSDQKIAGFVPELLLPFATPDDL